MLYLVPLLDNDIDPTAHTSYDQIAILGVLISAVLPLLVGLVTKASTDPKIKSLLLVALTAITAVLTEAQTKGSFVWQQALLTFVASFATAMTIHLGFYRPTGITGAVQGTLNKDDTPMAA